MNELQGSPTSIIGERSEGAVLAALLRAGRTVLLPFGGSHAYDLVTEQDGQFLRIQVKHGVVRGGVIQFRPYSSTGKGATKVVRDYKGRADLFGVYCSELDRVFLVPVDEVGVNSGYLRLVPPKNGQSHGVRLADQYELRAVVAQ